MDKIRQLPLKDKFKLWMEFLKRHEDLQKWLAWKRNQPEVSSELISRKLSRDIGRCQYKFTRKENYILKYFWIQDLFHGVLTDECSFDEWWDNYDKWHCSPTAVGEFINFNDPDVYTDFEHHHIFASEFIKRKYKEVPQIEEILESFKKKFLTSVKLFNKETYVITVSLSMDKTNEELAEEFLDLIKKRRKSLKLEKKAAFYKRYRFPMEPFYYDDLKRYLRVYDLRQKGEKSYSTIRNVIEKEFGPKESYYRTLGDDFRIAKEIIRNAAKGYFPLYNRKKCYPPQMLDRGSILAAHSIEGIPYSICAR